jgi:predicted ATPase/class 3 adenylate cyclase
MAAVLPSGTVTFLFSDIEGSTQLLLRLGDTYAGILGEYQRLMRQAFTDHGGVEVDTQGDSFFAAFPTATSAVAAAAEATRTLAEHPWPERGAVRARIGLHTGVGQVVDNHRYVGIDVHRAARIGAAGHGGQILLSESARVTVADDLPEGGTLRPLGSHWLKDLPQAEPLAQLVLAGLPSDFPDLKTLDRRPDHLPAQPTPFVGRDHELAEIQHGLDGSGYRLLTLVGTGGIGKTRLAIEAAQRNRASFTHGAHFVPLATVLSPDMVPFAIGDILEFTFLGPDAPLNQLIAYLHDKTLLLVLDNFEHLVSGAPMLADLLAGAPRLKVLVTSRERLSLQGEWVLPVESIEYPARADDDQFASYAAVQLFKQGAQRVQPAFALLDDAPCVLRICQLVEGLPLAIELAATWVRLLPCWQVADRLASSLDFLTSLARDVPERHRSLRAVFNQSWDMLTSTEQTAYAKLSVFHGPFDLQAAEEVGGASLAVLASLSDKSLLRADGQGLYTLHELLRQYAAAQLAQVVAEAGHRERAIEYLAGAATLASREAALRRAAGLLTQAIAIADDAGRSDLLAELRHKRGQLLMQVGAWAEARPDIVSVLAAARPDAVDLRVQALLELGEVEFFRYDAASARKCALDALDLAEAAGRDDLVADATVKLGFVETNEGNVEEALHIYERARWRIRPASTSTSSTTPGTSGWRSRLAAMHARPTSCSPR